MKKIFVYIYAYILVAFISVCEFFGYNPLDEN